MFNIIMGDELVTLGRGDMGDVVGMESLDHGEVENFGVAFPSLEPLDPRLLSP
jgi:hypothetical protein